MTDWHDLFRGEVWLTVNMAGALFFGEVLLRWRLVDRLSAPLRRLLFRCRLSSVMALALPMSVASSRAATALVAGAYRDGAIGRDEALWGTLALAFPGYWRRWAVNTMTFFAMAGPVGLVYALLLLVRSGLRFLFFFRRLPRRGGASDDPIPTQAGTVWRTAFKALPLAWAVYALIWWVMPSLDRLMGSLLTGALLPLSGWTVALSGIGSNVASLAAAGSAMASGQMTALQSLVALLLGSSLGAITRSLRQNGGYWFALFPSEMARSLVLWGTISTAVASLVTLMPFLISLMLRL